MTTFNCMTIGDDFSSFVSFEIAPVRDQSEPDHDGTDLAVCSPEVAEVWTIYGRLKTGEAMALHDAADGALLAAHLVGLMPRPPARSDLPCGEQREGQGHDAERGSLAQRGGLTAP